jgi:hypothetical protein
MKNNRKDLLMLGLAGAILGSSNDSYMGYPDNDPPVRHSYVSRSKTPLSPKQSKARAKTKRARKARKLHR